jgi:tetratricopeptide (TPR) repeat protein
VARSWTEPRGRSVIAISETELSASAPRAARRRPRTPAADAPSPEARALLAAAQERYDRGLYLQALAAAAPLGAPERWPGTEGRILGGRLLVQLGAARRGYLLHLRAHRLDPASGEAWAWAARAALERLGPWRALAFLAKGGPPGTPRDELLVLRSSVAAALRDFDEAERLAREALEVAPEDPWLQLQPAFLLAADDDHAGALATVDALLERRPWYRPAVDFRSTTLVRLGRQGEAEDFLRDALERVEARCTAELWLGRLVARDAWQEAQAALARIEALAPLRSPGYERWLEARRSDVAYHLGDRIAAAAHARRSDEPFYAALADRLEGARSTRRVVLPVPFVQQHHQTCAPATLASICTFHGVDAAHVEIAEAICYDGTPDHAERRWAAARGFTTREFTVTFDAARALVDRDLPFTLVMAEPGGSHLVAVAGYDEARGVLLLRDPSFSTLTEITNGWLEEHRSTGPRGMALAPPSRPDALDGLDLPDAGVYELYHRVQAALVEHDRPAAAAAAAALAAQAPGHRLARWAERSLATYDGSEERQLAAVEALLVAYPDDVTLRLSRQGALAALGQRPARIAWLRSERARRPHPLLDRALGEALTDDARDLDEALALCVAGVNRAGQDGLAYHLLADALWARGARDEALLAYRCAACLEPTRDHFAEAYFRAARFVGATEDALRFLRARCERYGSRSSRPAVVLVEALDALDRGPEALDALEGALRRRPADGALLLYAARSFAANGHSARARELLARARGPASEADRLRTEATLAELEGDLAAAAAARARVSELEPLSADTADHAARLLAATRDRAAAVAFLRARVERFPRHVGLGRTLAAWLETDEEREAELRRLVAAAPWDAWGHRELALLLSKAGRLDDAFAALERAAEVEPDVASLHNVRATVLARAGRLDEARGSLRTSIARDVDQPWAIERLLEFADGAAGRQDELRWVHAELVRQVTFGDGLLSYQETGAGVLAPEALLATLREAHAARPDLWHAWVALGRQLLLMERLDEAKAALEAAAGRFPLLPIVWVELGQAEHARHDGAAHRRALERAVALNPAWRSSTLQLAEALQGAGEFEAARAVLVRALRHGPADGILHGWLADALLGLGRDEEAVEELSRALRLLPDYAWALSTLSAVARRLGRPALPETLAEALVAERPGDARAWHLAGRTRTTLDGQLAALDRALALEPLDPDVVAEKVSLLAEAGRIDDALAAARGPRWIGPAPRSVRLAAVRAQVRARPADARTDLDALLAAEPDFLEAWELAADLADDDGRPGDVLRAGRALVRLAPHRALSHAWLAVGLVAGGDRAGAREALEHAVHLDPTHRWSVRRLLELAVEDRDLARAEELLVLVERHFSPEARPALRCKVALAQERWRDAARELAGVAEADAGEPLAAAVQGLARAPRWRELEAVLWAPVASGSSRRADGLAWYRFAAAKRGPDAAGRRVARACRRAGATPSPALVGAATPWLERLGELHARWRLRWTLHRAGALLAANVTTWGTVGYALTSAGLRRRAIAWLAGWRARDGVAPWMLQNLASALAGVGRAREAAEVCRAALQLPPDGVRARLQILGAASAAVLGDPAPDLELPDAAGLDPVFARIAALARAMRAALAHPEPRRAWEAAAPLLSAASIEPTLLSTNTLVRRLWWRALPTLLRHLGRSAPARAWWLARVLLVLW